MKFVNEGHLGGFVAADEHYPNGDPMTYTPKVWEYLLRVYDPYTVYDIGCGEGHAIRWFLDRRDDKLSLKDVGGFEGCQTAIEKGVVPGHIVQYDFAAPPNNAGFVILNPSARKLIWSCEFVEHVEEQHAKNFLRLFGQADVVAMTHAFPGQPGHHHVNCQPAEYWIDKMKAMGMELNHIATAESRSVAEPSHWKRSGLVFEKR